MKCNLSTINKLNKKGIDEINKYIRDESADYILKENRNCIRRVFKLIAVELNQNYGFGKKRLTDLFDACGIKANAERQQDPIYWTHVDRKVIDEIGVDFNRENYAEMGE